MRTLQEEILDVLRKNTMRIEDVIQGVSKDNPYMPLYAIRTALLPLLSSGEIELNKDGTIMTRNDERFDCERDPLPGRAVGLNITNVTKAPEPIPDRYSLPAAPQVWREKVTVVREQVITSCGPRHKNYRWKDRYYRESHDDGPEIFLFEILGDDEYGDGECVAKNSDV